MVDWELTAAAAADVEALAGIRARVMRADLERLGRYDEQRVRQRLRDGFEPAHTWTVRVSGALAGCVALKPAGHGYRLEHFYLAPELQGRGVGTAVLRRLLTRCDAENAPVRLNVLVGSAAARLYERHGFTVESADAVDVFMVRAPSGDRAGAGPGPALR
ncbi:GNAT family N-acetyltransferase [Streptomyces sp. t39]|uniref:GNAT family N-acetyltransferase n=1 Tax=Streptomyces sp. t39 TaxID=1828156 RepID=UPI0011CD5562|nr:GNAT family N-acetyltransferase [Streptomyces sp. t39]TXS52965.1 N-acetyltransferase [Streptomyces sp. t39]